MADEQETKVVKDPLKKSFWHLRNIGLIIITAALPALIGWAWNRSSTAITNYFARQKAQDERIKAVEDDTRQRLKDLEDDRANNKAIWDAITEGRNRDTQQDVDLRVLQKLFDREFGRGQSTPRSAPHIPKDPTLPETPQGESQKPPSPVKPDQLRLEKEAQHPIQKK